MATQLTLPSHPPASRPWQLALFDRSLKKRLKLAALAEQLGPLEEQACLLLTCGDNNGALNWHLRARGGCWTWADLEADNLAEVSAFLGEPVRHVPAAPWPFADGQFDCVVSIDVLEHLADDGPCLQELRRVLRPGGRAVVTVPNGNGRLLANRLKHLVGMRPAMYGHTRPGYTPAELKAAVARAGLAPTGAGGYSGFFTELVELAVNFSYVFVLSRRGRSGRPRSIAPASSRDIKTHGAAYRLYQLALPLLRWVSRLDGLLPAREPYAVIVTAVKPEGAGEQQ
jgi:SAM-dependent methyltransferase